MTDESLTIAEFCAAEKNLPHYVQKICSQGKGPRTFNVGTKRLISHEARKEWRRAREAEAAAADGLVAA